MIDCIFNELSFEIYVVDDKSLKSALIELISLARITKNHNHNIFIHREYLYTRRIGELLLRDAVNKYFSKEERAQVFFLLDKSTPSLPTDSAVIEECHFSYNGEKINCSGLAECAYRVYMGEDSLIYSLNTNKFSLNKITIQYKYRLQCANIIIANYYDLNELQTYFFNNTTIHSWDDIIELARKLPHIIIEESAIDSIKREPFELSLGKTLIKRFLAIEEMASSNIINYTKLDEKYCRGDEANFSDESPTRINKLGQKLKFTINGEETLCSFHGKISHRSFRIHMDGKPSPNKISHIVYIGYKIL